MNTDITLRLNWRGLGATEKLRRSGTGFDKVKEMVTDHTSGAMPFNAFLYTFLCSAKNFDLFLRDNVEVLDAEVKTLEELMSKLELFEREGKIVDELADECPRRYDQTESSAPRTPTTPTRQLRKTYLELRAIAVRPSARDEQRTLATLLFSGPSTAAQIEADLGISKNLADRMLRALEAVVEKDGEEQKSTAPSATAETEKRSVFRLREEPEKLAVVLYLLRYTLGIDPIGVLRRRINADAKGDTHGA